MSSHQNIEVLSSRPVGYIGKCQKCGAVQVVIGTVISEMSIAGFKNLCQSFENLSADVKNRTVSLPHGKKLVLGTGSDHIHICLSMRQFNQTVNMLQEALIELCLEQELNEILA